MLDKTIDFSKLFEKLSEPLTCGVVHSDGVRYQKSEGEWSSERIFVLSSELHKDKPKVLHRSFFDTDGSWREAITIYLRLYKDRCFKHPALSLYCLEKNITTCRELNFYLRIL